MNSFCVLHCLLLGLILRETAGMKWRDNDALFKQLVRGGHAWERYVGYFFLLQGLPVAMGRQTVRETIEEADQHSLEVDLKVKGVGIEVKGRNVSFTSPRDYPHRDAFVMPVDAWHRRGDHIRVVLLVSRPTGAMIWTPAKGRDQWTETTVKDSVRGIEFQAYTARKSLWRPVGELVAGLRKM